MALFMILEAHEVNGTRLLRGSKVKKMNCDMIQKNVVCDLMSNAMGNPYNIETRKIPNPSLQNDPTKTLIGQLCAKNGNKNGKKWRLPIRRLILNMYLDTYEKYCLCFTDQTVELLKEVEEVLKVNWTQDCGRRKVLAFFEAQKNYDDIQKEDDS